MRDNPIFVWAIMKDNAPATNILFATRAEARAHPYMVRGAIDQYEMVRVTHTGRKSVLDHLASVTLERDQLRKERDEAQAMVTAWHNAFSSIEAHIRDRMAMRDEANPETYLRIIHSNVANIIRDSGQVVAARWADYARHEAERDQLRAKLAEYEEALSYVETWICNPPSAYSVYALDGLFSQTREIIARSRMGGENE